MQYPTILLSFLLDSNLFWIFAFFNFLNNYFFLLFLSSSLCSCTINRMALNLRVLFEEFVEVKKFVYGWLVKLFCIRLIRFAHLVKIYCNQKYYWLLFTIFSISKILWMICRGINCLILGLARRTVTLMIRQTLKHT